MVDFSQFLRKTAGQAQKPVPLPIGDYPGVIMKYDIDDKNKNRTPYVRFQVKLTDWPNGVSEAERSANGEPIDLSKRQLRKDFFLTDDSLWRLDEFLKSCGVQIDDRTYEETLPETIGAGVVAQIEQYLSEKNNNIGNQIGALMGA